MYDVKIEKQALKYITKLDRVNANASVMPLMNCNRPLNREKINKTRHRLQLSGGRFQNFV